jgi:hypothetical protein
MESRAAVFTSSPQVVEVYQAGAWWAGELLGWRHENDGSCQVWVRVTLAGVEETAWTDLAALRLPERHLSVAPEPAGSADPSSTQKLPLAAASRRERPALAPAATASMPAVRDLSAVPAAPRPGGRRRAPETGETQAVAAVAPRSGGRRRAPEEPSETLASEVVAATPASPGRHRAAAAVDAGRHRAADTGLFPVITEALPAVSMPAVAVPAIPSARPPRLDDTFGGRSRGAWGAVGEPEPELLTRPMRLSDHIPHARRPRLDGTLTGV